MQENARQILVDSLRRRTSTFTVAKAILDLGLVSETNDKTLHRELSALAGTPSWGYYQMNDDFDRVDPADTQLVTFSQLFPDIDTTHVSAEDATSLYGIINVALTALGIDRGTASEAMQNRLNLSWERGIATSKKSFTKRLRFLRDLEQKADRVQDTTQLRHAQMQAKSRLAYAIDTTEMDDASLAFCAYLAARANRRSLFMLGGQSKAFDTISSGLEKLLTDESSWAQIALVKPTMSTFQKLTDEERGVLVGTFHREMQTSARELEKLWPTLPTRMRAEMVMVRGVDSSRWNAYAGALNTMRSAWISATIASGLENLFDTYLPGKAPRLMAADVVWWARNSGQELHEDTRMFGALPRPWDVISGKETLTRDKIMELARHMQVDATKSGWVGPRAAVDDEAPRAEPATVHGVVISDPEFAKTLRRMGVFSGKEFRHLEDMEDFTRREVAVDGKIFPVIDPV